jgi:hypothetical protein
MLKKLSIPRETMALTLVLWLCALPLVALLVVPFFGLSVAAVVAVLLLVVMLITCWGICGWGIWHKSPHLNSSGPAPLTLQEHPAGMYTPEK